MKTSVFSPGRRSLLCVAISSAVLAGCGGGGDDNNTTPPVASNQLYSQSNTTANSIVHMRRAADGTLTVANSTLTGGTGTNTGADPLVSQNAVIVSKDRGTLFAVNAASNSVSSFSIDPTSGDLKLLSHNATTGNFPNSLAFNNGVLYVLFQQSKVVQAYPVTNGVLGPVLGAYAIPNAGMSPTQITTSPNGSFLTVSAGTDSNALVSYPIGANGTLGTPVTSTTGVVAPFAGVFLNNTTFLSTAAGAHALQTLTFANGAMTPLGTPLVGDVGGVPCWLVITPDGKYAYTGNGGTGSISSYTVAASGALTLLKAQAANENIMVAGDSWISADGKYLYTAYLAAGQVISYSIGADGNLTKIGSPATVASGNTMQGLAGI